MSTLHACMPSGVTSCASCGCDVTADNLGALRYLRHLRDGAALYLSVCQSCAEAEDAARAQKAPAPPTELQRQPARNAGRKHPPYGAALAADPPPADEALHVLMGWDYADKLPDPKLIVRDEDNPARLRFDVADGRAVRVVHRHDADPDRLLKLAQALIDYGAREVEMVIHPPRPGSYGTELLRIVPKVGA